MSENTQNNLATVIMSLLLFAALAWAIPTGMKKEAKRQEIVQQDRCAKHGYAIDRWAERRGIENPCRKVGP